MALYRDFMCTKDNTSRPDSLKGQGASDWLMIGHGTTAPNKERHRAYLDFSGFDIAANWNEGDRIVKIELLLVMSNTHNWSFGKYRSIFIGRISGVNGAWNEGNAGDGSWHADDYVNESSWMNGVKYPLSQAAENQQVWLDLTDMLEPCIPSKVYTRAGTPGGALRFFGLKFQAWSETNADYRSEIWGRGAAGSYRPRLRVTYDVGKVAPNPPGLLTPSGDTALGGYFTGTFSSNQAPSVDTGQLDILTKATVQVWTTAATPVQVGGNIDSTVYDLDPVAGTFSIPIPAWVKPGVSYTWTAQVWDQQRQASPFTTPRKAFRVTSVAPTLVVSSPTDPLPTLANYLFLGAYSDTNDPKSGLQFFQFQVRTATDPSNPGWAVDPSFWDSGTLTPPAANEVSYRYGGPELAANTAYSFRMRVTNLHGGSSAWSYGTFSTAAAYTPQQPPPDDDYQPLDPNPDPETPWYDNYDELAAAHMTGYNRLYSGWRIVLRAMGANRGPGTITAIITDAANIGASVYANSPGEMYFTLPATHPQIGACEPYQTHYSIETYVGDRWVEKWQGILDDFDATEEEVVFHGIDYLGLLSLVVDERKDGLKNYTDPLGSKYTNVPISTIIHDQLVKAKALPNSPIGFITIPAENTNGWTWMSERVSLATPYVPVLGTVTGLMDSHKAGTGRRSRLFVYRALDGSYAWRLYDNYGKDRPDLKLEWGGLINGYRIVGFGDFGTVVLGMGRKREGGVSLLYANGESPLMVGGQTMQQVFGRISKTALWQDLYDETDLKRRVKERALVYGKIGKRVALAIKVDGLGPMDGYEVMDNAPVVINRGPVQTDRYGSGLWTVWGVAWKLYPDGHQDTTITVLPKEDGVPISGDIVGSTPILDENDWVIGRVPPPPIRTGKWYLDQTTGTVYHWDSDFEAWVVYSEEDLLGTPDPPSVISSIVTGVVTMKVIM